MSDPRQPKTRDGFQHARESDGVLFQEIDGERIPLILRHRDVRAAAKNWQTYSSDAPFRVPIPSEERVRAVRQIPIELDPPQHGAYRKLLEPWFLRPTKPDYVARIDELVDASLLQLRNAGEIEIVSDFALPLQSRALAVLLEMPLSEADRWITWGNSLYREGDGVGKGQQVDTYIRDELDRARADPEATDFFAFLVRLELDGRSMTDDELAGIANLTFAGGRDTVINAIAEVVAHFAGDQDSVWRTLDNPRSIASAVEELVRYVSPLSFIGRVCPTGAELLGNEISPDARIGLCFASANRDPEVFDRPDELILDRRPNPHMGFGSGRHSCLGAAHARELLRSLVRALPRFASSMELVEELAASEQIGEVQRRLGYNQLRVICKA